MNIFTKTILAIGLISMISCGEDDSKVEITTTGGPMMSIESTNHSFGTLEFGSEATCEFKVFNTGDQPLVISQCKASCGCTVPECTKEPISPGESTQIKITYDTKKKGKFNKTVTVYSNSIGETEKMLRIEGEVLADKNADNQETTN
ncbi:MAG: DUF1573 domain-containing protein [Flavobacteriales bacterium]|nr:DUF1573 domain-containing protein [Flavobacteriales bacterium]